MQPLGRPLRRSPGRVRRAGGWTLLAGALGCTPPAAPQTTTGPAPAKQPITAPEPVEPVEPVEPQPTEPVRPAAGSEQLDGRTLIASHEGPWTLRRLGPGGFDGSADAVGESGGLGTIGTIGKGSGSGSGRGYGGGGGARAEAEESSALEAKRARAPMADAIDGSPEPMSIKKRRDDRPPADAPLKAGSTDDNADFKGYLKFLETWTARSDVRGDYQPLDVAGRVFIKVVDGDRRPLPGVAVVVTDPQTKAPLWKATTYGDGRAPYYPKLFGPGVQQGGPLMVTATVGGAEVAATWDGRSDVTLAGDKPVAVDAGLGLDVVFLIDTTGSMGDELERIKTSLLAVTGKLKGKRADLQLRYGAVAYKDLGDDYVTMAHPFTDDAAAFNTAMQALSAGGGGDLPESLNQGLARAVEGLQWRPDAAKVVFLVADAAPQMRFKGDVLYGDSGVKAVGLGIRVHSVAASGLDPLGTLVLRQIAQLTRGKFIFIEYGDTQASAARHGVTGAVQGGNNLDEILLAQLTAEIDGWGK